MLEMKKNVHMTCNVVSNPAVKKVLWFFDGHILTTNTSRGIFIRNETLLMSNVSREHGGRYQCAALNAEGKGESEEVDLKVTCEYHGI